MKYPLVILTLLLFLSMGCGDSPDIELSYSQLFDINMADSKPVRITATINGEDTNELNGLIMPDGRNFYFTVWNTDNTFTIMNSEFKDRKWMEPKPALFSREHSNADPAITVDGKTIYFISNRPVSSEMNNEWNIFYVENSAHGWSETTYYELPGTGDYDLFYPTVSNQGNLYFTARMDDSYGERDIYYVKHADNRDIVHLNNPPNSEYDEGDISISPDESYLITKINGHPETKGRGDLFISFKDASGNWSKPENLSGGVNTEHHEYSPYITFDGRYLFFTRVINGKSDLYCISTKLFLNNSN